MRQRRSTLPVLLVLMLTSLAGACPARGQVVRDATLGAGRDEPVAAGVDPQGAATDYLITDDLGKTHGGNLFHSFREFNLRQGESAAFTGPDSIDLVIARVTGGSRSSIDGSVRSTIPGSSLLFLNPAGLLFGPDASLDVPGAFHASASEAIDFGGDGFRLLQPSAALEVQAARLFAPQGLVLRGTEVLLEDARLEAGAGSSLDILATQFLDAVGSRADAGAIRLDAPVIRLSSSQLTPRERLDVSADFLLLEDGSRIEAPRDGSAPARYDIRAQDLVLREQSRISAPGGLVRLQASLLLLEDASSVSTSTRGTPQVGGGRIEVEADQILVRTGARIESFSSGDGGSIDLRATDVIELTDAGSGVFAISGMGGAGGMIAIRAPRVSVRDGARISTSSDLELVGSQPGNIRIDGGFVSVTRDAVISSTSPAASSGSPGIGGSIAIDSTGALLVSGSGIQAPVLNLTFGRIELAEVAARSARVSLPDVTRALIDPRDMALAEVPMLERCGLPGRGRGDSFRPDGRDGIPETPRRMPAARYSRIPEPLGPADRGDVDGFLATAVLDDAPGWPVDTVLRTAEVLEARGVLARARALLSGALLRSAEPERARVLALRGRILARSAEPELAEHDLAEAERVAEEIGASDLRARVLLDRAQLDREQSRPDAAQVRLARALEHAEQAGDAEVRALARAALARHEVARGETESGGRALATALGELAALPATHERLFAALHLGLVLAALPDDASRIRAGEAFARTAEQARVLGDPAAASYAWSYLAELYAREGRLADAVELARRGVAEALRSDRPGAVHESAAQLGQILQASGDLEGTTRAYTVALQALERVRSEASLAPHVQAELASAFPSQPLSTELVGVLLERAAQASDAEARASLLRAARERIEASSRRELRDYFQDECLAREARVSLGGLADALVVYPVMFGDRAELLVSGPRGMDRVAVPVPPADLQSEIESLRSLVEDRTTHEYRAPASRLYTWLIEPLEPLLAAEGPERTLVFVPSGPFANLPFAALYDARRGQFLIEQHAIALSPGLSLIEPRSLGSRPGAVLQAALTGSVSDWPALASARDEVTQIRELTGGKVLLDAEFVPAALDRELGLVPYEIVHIASHAQFGGDAESTYLLTFDGRLGMSELADLVSHTRFRDRPLELLTLSACQTAAGNERAALGLAGVAVRAGARSTLASLWSVNDLATARLMRGFYRQLVVGRASRAQALQIAQRDLLQDTVYRHPAYWAPFVLVGSWR